MIREFFIRTSFLFAIAGIGFTVPSYAHNAIKMTDGEGSSTVFMLGDNPKVTQSDSELTVETLQTTLTCSLTGGVRFEFIDYTPENKPGEGEDTENPKPEDPTPSLPDDSEPSDDPEIKDDVDAGVSQVYGVDKMFVITPDAVEGRNLKAGETVTLTDLTGKTSALTKTDTQGYFSISTAGMAPGMYILISADKSFKFIVR